MTTSTWPTRGEIILRDFDRWCLARRATIQRHLDAVEGRVLRARSQARAPAADDRHSRWDQWWAGVYGVGHGCPPRVARVDGPPEQLLDAPYALRGPGR